MEKIKFLIGGRTGDLLHCLLVIKSICENINSKAILFITENGILESENFSFSLQKTFLDLSELISYQNYIEDFRILENLHDLGNEFINLNNWRKSPLLYKTNWINILINSYNIKLQKNSFPWLDFKKNTDFSEIILIHRSANRHNHNFPWDRITALNKCQFLATKDSIHEYNLFPFKDKVDLLVCENFSEMATIINSCRFFVGNMSTPLALAHSFGKPRLAELFLHDEYHYIGEEYYLENYFYFTNNGSSSIQGIEKFLNL